MERSFEITSMQIKINFTNDQFILIDLFDNTAVRKWFHNFSSDEYIMNIEEVPRYSDKIDIEVSWNLIRKTFDDLKELNYNPSLVITNEFDKNQETLNILHRFFTYNAVWAQKTESNRSYNIYDKDFKYPASLSYADWHKIIDQINVAVHQLENTIIRNTGVKQIRSLKFKCKISKHLEWLKFDNEEYVHNYEYFTKKLEHQYLVLLDRSILGKCPLQAFIENDNPLADDCTGRFGSFGGFIVELDDTRNQVYQSSKFTNWARMYNRNVADLPCEFPLGYINETNIIDLTNLKQFMGNYKNLEFINN
jgi:hypothetical protein